uniref:Nuclease associated modular domain-containing protein n=1 Tax=Orbilia brochopaga TaxID=3140254 RepID=A0A4Y5MXM4_9PEZI|nr:hypothetical protein [Drechslerella brochopaga]
MLKKAGSSLGFKHSKETREKMRDRRHSAETKKILSKTNKGKNNLMYGKPKSESSGKPSQKISVFDNKNNITTIYDSINAAAAALKINISSISMYFTRNRTNLYKGRYVFKKL